MRYSSPRLRFMRFSQPKQIVKTPTEKAISCLLPKNQWYQHRRRALSNVEISDSHERQGVSRFLRRACVARSAKLCRYFPDIDCGLGIFSIKKRSTPIASKNLCRKCYLFSVWNSPHVFSFFLFLLLSMIVAIYCFRNCARVLFFSVSLIVILMWFSSRFPSDSCRHKCCESPSKCLGCSNRKWDIHIPIAKRNVDFSASHITRV